MFERSPGVLSLDVQGRVESVALVRRFPRVLFHLYSELKEAKKNQVGTSQIIAHSPRLVDADVALYVRLTCGVDEEHDGYEVHTQEENQYHDAG